MSCHVNHLPRILVTPSLWPVSARAAVPPRAQMTLGRIAKSCRWRNWPQISISSGSGAFADEDQRGLWIANAEDDLIAAFGEAATAAIAHVLDDLEEGIASGG